MTDMLVSQSGRIAIEALLQYALRNGLIAEWDVVQSRNALFALLRYEPEDIDESMFNSTDDRAGNETATAILRDILDDCVARGLIMDTVTARDLMEGAVMGLCMPRMSETMTHFLLHYTESPMQATDYFYKLCRAAHYIQVDRIKRNLYWTVAAEYGELEITINLSKPEKDPRDIAAARVRTQTQYPRCLLCLENVGYAGTMDHPARQNLRVIPMTLDDEPWYFQYSPYLYYNEHCIVFNEKHEPMRITEGTFVKLIEFVNDFPHYFIGSNADLPIVGGSILSHDHFQGGRHVFPMEKAASYARYVHPDYPAIGLSLVQWPLSVIRLCVLNEYDSDEARKAAEWQMTTLANQILTAWRAYADPKADIIPFTGDTPHNTVTPIARYNNDHRLEMDIVLRNNRTTDEYPLGIFHPHTEWHHIKKENIGLIEVMGLAVLPGRLRDELAAITKRLTGVITVGVDVSLHSEWIDGLLNRYGEQNMPERAEEIIREEVGHVFTQVLRDCGVFKDTDAGRTQFARFMTSIGAGLFRQNVVDGEL